jgi:glucan 1,3-beta-glucosidase
MMLLALRAALFAALRTRSAAGSVRAPCSTWYDNTTHGSSFRSVVSFGATGDGKIDDTAAIQAAINFGVGSVQQKLPALVYFPPGRYLVSDTLVMYYHTHLTGSLSAAAGCRATLVLANSAPGFGDASRAKPVLVTDNGFNRNTSSSPWWEDSTDKNMLFYAQVHHLDFVLGTGNQGAVGILWAVAQQTSLRDISVAAGDSVAGIDVGFSQNFGYALHGGHMSCGGGGTVNGVTVSGGQYGVRVSASQWYLDQIKTTGQSVAGVLVDQAWAVVLLGVQASHAPIGLLLLGAGENIQLLSSFFGPAIGNGSAVVPRQGVKAGQLLLSNVSTTTDVEFLVDRLLAAGNNSRTWYLSGQIYDSGRPRAGSQPQNGGGFLDTFHPPPEATNIPLRARPTLTDLLTPPVNARSCCGAKGDGASDDTQALQRAINSHSRVFLPNGKYVISDTITLQPNTVLVGEGMPHLMLRDGAAGFGDPTNPKPMLLAPSNASATTVLADLALTTEHGQNNANLGAILLQWGCGPRSSTFDLHVQLFAPVHTAIHVTGSGGGVISNTWGWGGDHNLTTNQPMAPHLSATTHWLGAESGLRVDSQGPLWLLGTQFEHHRYDIHTCKLCCRPFTLARDLCLLTMR